MKKRSKKEKGDCKNELLGKQWVSNKSKNKKINFPLEIFPGGKEMREFYENTKLTPKEEKLIDEFNDSIEEIKKYSKGLKLKWPKTNAKMERVKPSLLKNHVKFEFPKGWKMETPIFDDGLLWFDHPTEIDSKINFISETPIYKNCSVTDIWGAAIKIDEINKGYRNQSRRDIKVKDFPASEHMYSFKLDGEEITVRNIFIWNKKYFVQFVLQSLKENFEKNNKVFNKVLDSINWK